MKKRIVILVALMAVLLLVAGPVHATRLPNAGGLWLYIPTIEDERSANGNTILTITEEGIWSGTFEGISTEEGTVVIHSSGSRFFRGTVSFDEVWVDGKSGALEMRVVGSSPDVSAGWEGKWVILGGTGELATLRGQGTWWGLGWLGDPTVPGEIPYSGNIHFKPVK